MSKKKKQAVLLIHGIGEQLPMDTLRGFVKTVWTTDQAIHHQHAIAGLFSKPDDISGSFEMRRLTTTKNKNGVRTDFFEYYWAHMMKGTSVYHVLAWVRFLFSRCPWNVPKHLLSVWLLLVVFMLVILALVCLNIIPYEYRIVKMPGLLLGLLSTLITWSGKYCIENIIGDAARYLYPAPSNIQSRQEIRSKGVELLKKLHESKQYDRIIIVGHSLGSVIGYDILTCAWSLYNEVISKPQPANPVLTQMETSLKQMELEQRVSDYQKEQHKLHKELRANGNPWLVTDFITLGSPLRHAELLLAQNTVQLTSKQNDRELPTCPPKDDSLGKFSYPADCARRILHHAAVFGPTRWTNLYFPARWLVIGDFIGGPLKDLFGWGINDRSVQTHIRWGFFSHTLYWKQCKKNCPDNHIVALRESLNLLEEMRD